MPSFGDHPTEDMDDFSKTAPDEDTSGPIDDDDSVRVRGRVRPFMDIMNTDEGPFEEADEVMTAEGARAGSWAYAGEDEEEGEEGGTRDESMDLGVEASLRRGVYAALSQYDSERAGTSFVYSLSSFINILIYADTNRSLLGDGIQR